MRKEKGFTLIELLAVIIILGVIMLIAIPSVTRLINDSRKETYLDTARQIVKGAIPMVNGGELDVYDTNTTYYIPASCIPTENSMSSPFGEFEQAYVIVGYTGEGYVYYWASVDKAHQGIEMKEYNKLTKSDVKPNMESVDTTLGIGSRTDIKILDEESCQSFVDSSSSGGGGSTSSTTTTDNKTWTNGIFTLTFDIASSCDTTSTEKVCNVTITGSNSDSSHLIIDSNSTFTVPSGTRIAGGPYTSENLDVTVSGTTLTVIGNKNYKHDRFTSNSEPRSTSLRIAYPKDAEFVLSNGNITYNVLGDAVHVYDLTNMKVTLTRTGYTSVDTHKMKIKNTVKVENKTNNTLSGWSFRISANGLTSANIINPLKKISEGTNYVVVGPVVNNSYTDNLPPLGNSVQEDKIEFVLNDINSEIIII